MWWARPNPKQEVAAFDSATAMLRALSRFLRGQDVPLLGELPPGAEPVMSAVMGAANRLPRRLAEKAYAASGWTEAMPVRRLGEVSSDALAEWITGHYPRRRHPVILIGSTGGALTHLAAALDAPWLPQTLLLPVRRRGGHPDEPLAALEHGRPAAEALLAGNPDLVLHQMHDANQDRLMVAGMSYFRVKWTRLPPAYRRFIKDHLAPDGTVVIAECGQSWPTTRIGERHVFQHGGYGSLDPEEIQHGSPRVAEYLARYGSPYRKWDGPEPDARRIGTFTGVDTRAYPRDFACLARAHRELAKVRDLFPMPSPLPLAAAEEHLTGRDDLDWTPQ